MIDDPGSGGQVFLSVPRASDHAGEVGQHGDDEPTDHVSLLPDLLAVTTINGGIDVCGQRMIQVAGPDPKEVGRRLGAKQMRWTTTHVGHNLPRLIAKVAYTFLVGDVGLGGRLRHGATAGKLKVWGPEGFSRTRSHAEVLATAQRVPEPFTQPNSSLTVEKIAEG